MVSQLFRVKLIDRFGDEKIRVEVAGIWISNLLLRSSGLE